MKASHFAMGYFVHNEVCSLKLKTWKDSCDFCSYSMDIIKRKFGESEFNLASIGHVSKVHS